MLVVFLMILALGLLAAIVVGLHKHQRRELVSNVDRQSPLPPLDTGITAKFSTLEDSDSATGQADLSDEQVNDKSTSEPSTERFSESSAEPFAEASDEPTVEPESTSQLYADNSRNWTQECNDFKNKEMYTEALAVCQLHFPQWGAFNLACTVLRANIRNDIKNDRDISSLLQQLFRCAACASFLHDKSTDLPALTQRQLKQLPVSAWQALEMPFDKIGYTELRLLGKADHRLIRETWGEPAHNISARLYHRDSWLRLIKVYGDIPADISADTPAEILKKSHDDADA